MAQLQAAPDRTIHHRHVTTGGLQLDCRLTAVKDAGGEVTGFAFSVFDTAEMPELAEPPDRARWRFALESAQDGLWDWSAESGRVYRSSRCFTMLGYPRQYVGDELHDWRPIGRSCAPTSNFAHPHCNRPSAKWWPKGLRRSPSSRCFWARANTRARICRCW